jgi:EAL domain-containing protein (putative c-di-GMP-specific phosphodiesterase class I)
VRDSGLQTRRLRLEVVESTLLALERSEPFVAGLAPDGIGLHVDDFGTGYSSLTALHGLPISALKIDRRRVAALDQGSNRAIARSVIALAHSLDVAAIGAGIESESAREALRELGCDAGQGVFVAPVLPDHAIADLLDRAR